MKFYQKRSFALVVLILAIIGSGVYGISKKPAALPEVSYYNWICDEAGLLDQETRQTIQDYNTAWNEQYYAVVAVAAVDDIRGWSSEDYARELGARWGLGANDMLLLLVKGGELPVTSVRLTRAIPKDMIFPVMDEIRKVVLTAPVKAGTIVLHNVCGLDSDVMVTKNVDAC